jgi:glycosyltransferase involved in cell wall biosynthesis
MMAVGSRGASEARRRPRVHILARKVLVRNTRIFKQASSLTAAGYEVCVIGIKPRDAPALEHRDGYTIIRLELDPIHARVPRRLLRTLRRLERAVRRVPARYRRLRARVRRGLPGRLWLRRRRRAVRRTLGRIKRALVGDAELRLPAWPRPVAAVARALVGAPLHALRRAGRTIRDGVPRAYVAAARGGERRLRRFTLRVAWPSRSLAYYQGAWRLATTSLPPPDIVHANDLDTLYVAARIARRYRVPLVYDAQELYTGVHTLPRWYRALLRVQERVLLRRVDRLTVVNDAIATVMERRYRRKVDRVVLNCPPFEEHVANGSGSSLRDLLPLPGDRPVLVYSGALSARRGIENTVLALGHIPGASLVLLGDGPLRPAIEDLIAREQLTERVFFCDFVRHLDVPKLISSADVGIVPYENVGMNHYLGSPSKLFHYIMAELPIACSDFPFLRSVVAGHGLGAVFDPDDPRSIARAVSLIVGDHDHRQAIKRNLSVARRRYCWEVEEEGLLAVYRSLDAREAVPA